MLKIAAPVIDNLCIKDLKKELPNPFDHDRNKFSAFEAFARTACGIAPWLELEGLSGYEADKQDEYRCKLLLCFDAATDPDSADYLNFGRDDGKQQLVEAAFLAQSLLRAPKQIAANLKLETKKRLINELKQTRAILITHNNWLFFSAMVEAGLFILGQTDYDMMRIDYAFKMFEEWYVGDGLYGDGKYFHFDYYNSFVIYPMMLDILNVLGDKILGSTEWQNKIRNRAVRYAAILEREIAPDGSFPAIGRSLTYRFGAFQLLSQAALLHFLPSEVTPPQTRCGLTAIIDRVCAFEDMFDTNGWLRPGLCGYQPELAEGYISTGSLYLCMAVFLVLGLHPNDEFWSGADEDWTSKKIWSGKKAVIDHAIDF